ncbi:hypothetical protein I6A84_14365 [Frankia sp. CNm7]|uniref:Uncharacterized protein n=2 Tax=Frankia nepalensis TaxID=1836974 RepID=A0A937UQI3_9ACTN|nr:hypothetical protein [Frankia nepalensis]MBL7495649.1 hypothetical protein [Frankia nepalensis]MBL7515760.1 hypothetical protein [Frankia nepalensis]MBL7519257.1 hypothetical protein [Frankia nepalensis]MBL7630118.1 hypothetical protein [Frankia nepalensis]
MDLREVRDVVGEYTGNARTVLEYSMTVKRLLDGAKEPGFSVESWAPLAELVAVDEFERVGNFKEAMTWQDYVKFLTLWAISTNWECSFKRLTERPGVVYLELEERSRLDGNVRASNSLSVYEFNEFGKIRHLDVYLQIPLPNPAILHRY